MDRFAIETFKLSGTILMERAGTAAFQYLSHRWPKARSLAVVCGAGNNGGDGFVVARLAHEKGLAVKVYQVGDGAHIGGDALAAAQRLAGAGLTPEALSAADFSRVDVIIDALLGTGLEGEVSGHYREAIEQINAAGREVLSLDIPSGLQADTGVPQGCAVKAAGTVTFIGLKQGLFTAQGSEYCGELVFASLNVPAEVYELRPPAGERIDYTRLKHLLRPRPRHCHKGDCGHVLIVGGERGYTGAVRMAGEAAARIGAGLVSIATRPEHAMVLNATRPELMCHGVDSEVAFQQLAERASVIAIGPGLGQGEWSKKMLAYALDSGLPLVVDADALNLLSQASQQREDWVLTPHPGEAARLLGKAISEVERDRFAALDELVDSLGGVVVLKGAGSLVKSRDQAVRVCSGGNPGMASGGMGDVLTGIIAGLLAQGLVLADAAALGVALHAEAGDQAARAAGERGLLASDLMPWVRRLANPGNS
ncbi:MAG: NAD(P)H-hydrate dehydratase [Gammaproteobacteria bacterium]